MNKTLAISAFLTIAPLTAFAGEFETIISCIQFVNAYTRKYVDEFYVCDVGRILGFCSAEWSGIECEINLTFVYNLTVDGRRYFYERISGRQVKNRV